MKTQIEIFLIPLLKILSDPDYQERIWFKKDGPRVSSYMETVEEFSEISESFIFNDEIQKLLGSRNLEMLKKLSSKIDAFHITLKDKELENIQLILSNPKWHDIQILSKDLYHALNKSD